MRRYIVGICLGLLLSTAASFAETVSVNIFTKNLTEQLSEKSVGGKVGFPDGIKTMVQHFCRTVMAMDPVLDYGANADTSYLFDPKQSMFLYVLCSDLKE
jgi:hypothetical protein